MFLSILPVERGQAFEAEGGGKIQSGNWSRLCGTIWRVRIIDEIDAWRAQS